MAKLDVGNFEYLQSYAMQMGYSKEAVIGREKEMIALDATMQREVMKSILLLAPPGSGKTAIVEQWAQDKLDKAHVMSIDLVAMGGQGESLFAERIKKLIQEVINITDHHTDLLEGKELVLFIDELHMLGMPKYAVGLEALKPAMARGEIKLIGATTDEEFTQWVLPNQALYQRFQALNVPEPSLELTKQIIRNMWKRALPKLDVNEHLVDLIVEYGKFFPADAQPRKSIKILDDMIGWHRAQHFEMNEKLLNDRVYAMSGANPKWSVDVDALINMIKTRVKGQDFALNALEGSLHVAVANLADESRPMGVFIFTGTTGTGKTEMAKAMAQGLFGREEAMIRFDMSEFQSKDSVDVFRFKASDAIRKTPYAVVLFDEIEKAHPGVLDLMLQITDDGRLSDRYGRQTTFKNAYIILTTNVGYQMYQEAFEQGEPLESLIPMIQTALIESKKFRPEMMGRIDAVVPFKPLSMDVRQEIATMRLKEIASKLGKRGILMKVHERAVVYITKENMREDTFAGGGRDINRKVKQTLAVTVARLINTEINVVECVVSIMGHMSAESKYTLKGDSEVVIESYITKLDNGDYERVTGDLDLRQDAFHPEAKREIILKSDYERDRARYIVQK